MATKYIISDVHGDWDALEAVLHDIYDRGGQDKDIVCLGDIVGYGPEPRKCLEESKKWGVVLKGNHERIAETKIASPNFVIGREVGITGFNVNEGIHWAIRDIYQRNMPLPPKPVDEEKVNTEWKPLVEEQTKNLIENMRSSSYEQRLIQKIFPEHFKDIEISLGARFKQDRIVKELIQKLFFDPKYREKLMAYSERVKQKDEGNALLHYMVNLPRFVKKKGVLYVHDNPFKPGDSRYIFDPETFAARPHNKAYSTEQVFNEFDWGDIQVIFFGHSHFSGLYTSDDETKVLVNPGSVGMARRKKQSDELEISYAIWNEEEIKIKKLPLKYWTMRSQKMKKAGL